MATPSARLLIAASFANLPSPASTTSSKTSQRRMPSKIARHVLVVSLFLVVLGAALPSWAMPFTVTSTADSGPGSLRAALSMAADGDTINFSLTYPATITLTSGNLTIGTSVTISGPGPANLFISGNNEFLVFSVDGGVAATISGVTIENAMGTPGGIFNNGTLTVSNSTFSGNSTSFGPGGGISNAGMLTVSNSTFSGNFTNIGDGGAIFNQGGSLTVNNSTFSGNSAFLGDGGGIFNQGGSTLTVSNSTFSGNYAPGVGVCGAIDNGGTATVSNSTFSGNSGTIGGGICNNGTATVSNSTFSGNGAGPGEGGGIVNFGTLTVSFSTFSGNFTSLAGAAIATYGPLTLKSTLLAGQTSGGNCAIFSGTAASDGYNLSDDNSCTFLTATGDQNDITGAASDLGPLQNNGGPTSTIALLPGSTAIDAIPVTPVNECTDAFGNPVPTDQRGVTRPQGSGCDIGAYELVQTPPVAASPTSISFGNVELCRTKKEVVTLHNNGSTKVHFGPISFIDVTGNPSDFRDIEYCHNGNLRPGKSCTLAVKFSPSEEAPEAATLNIVTSAPGSPVQVPITGTGIANKNCD
jgi:hypothetical protein